jgi:hypothetical protein
MVDLAIVLIMLDCDGRDFARNADELIAKGVQIIGYALPPAPAHRVAGNARFRSSLPAAMCSSVPERVGPFKLA